MPAALLLLALLASGAALSGPLVLRAGIDHVTSAGPVSVDVLTGYAVWFVALAAVAVVLTAALTLGAGWWGERAIYRLRTGTYLRVVHQDRLWHDRRSGSALVSRLTADADLIEDFLQQAAVPLLQTGATLVILLCGLLVLSWPLALASFLPLLVLGRETWAFRRRAEPAYLSLRERAGRTMTALEEYLTGVRVVRAFSGEALATSAYASVSNEQHRAELTTVRHQARYLPVVELATTSSTAVALGLGGWLVHDGQLSVGTLTAFLLYLLVLGDPVQTLSYLMTTMQSAAAARHRLRELLVDASAGPRVESAANPSLPDQGEIVLTGVTFGYAETPVLTGVDLVVRAGERLALVGPTGAGKSTLAQLLGGLLQPSSGTVTYAGRDLVRLPTRMVRERVVVLEQQPYLFSGTVLDNLTYASGQIDEAVVERLLVELGVDRLLGALPQGLRTEVGDGGENLSLGVLQVIGIARAALSPARVVVLDEVTAHVDPATEQVLVAALDRLFQGRTVVVIAHRLGTVAGSDRIAVVADGAIAELGSHDELLALDGRYAALWADWSSPPTP
jgi:ATP-binding cassette subfamily B protein